MTIGAGQHVTDLRRFTIGGSEIAAVCGLDPYTSPVMLAARKLGLAEPQPETQAMRIGKRLEPLIAELAGEHGYEVMPAPAGTLADPARKWCVGKPDGYTAHAATRAVAELKAVGQLAHREGWNGEPPLRYQAQGQWYMHLTGLPACVVFALVGGQRFEVYTCELDEQAIGYLLDRAEGFVKLLRRGKLPDIAGTESEKADLLRIFPEAEPMKLVRLDRDHWHTVRELCARREQLAAVKAQCEELENRLKAFMGDAELAISPHDEDALRWTTVRARRIDTGALKAARPEVAEEFTTVTTTRRFTLL